jgi:hypothetical protein
MPTPDRSAALALGPACVELAPRTLAAALAHALPFACVALALAASLTTPNRDTR